MGGSVTKLHQYTVSSTFIHEPVLDEIFQHVDLLKLLTLRRVCRHWQSLISRETALYHRQVAIKMYQVSNASFHSQEELVKNFWQHTRRATTLLLFEDTKKKLKRTLYHDAWYVTAILRLYTIQVRVDGRARQLERFVFADTTLREDDFRIPARYRSNICVTLRRCSMMVRMESTFDLVGLQERPAFHHWLTRFLQSPLLVEMLRLVPYSFYSYRVRGVDEDPEATLRWLDNPDLADVFDHLPNPTADFLLGRCKTKAVTYGRMHKLAVFRCDFFFDADLHEFIEALVRKFNPGKEELLFDYLAGDFRRFCSEVHPLVIHFLFKFRKVVKKSPFIFCSETRQKIKTAQTSA